MKRIIPSDAPAPSTKPPKDMFMGIIGNDGSFRWYEPHQGQHVYDSPGYKLTAAESLIDDTWWTNQNDYSSGQWRAGVGTPLTETQTVYIKAEDWGDRVANIAEQAARFAGIEIPNLSRHADGFFYCPHCGGRYDYLGGFQSHLRSKSDGCEDNGATILMHGDAFRRANCSSRKTWLRYAAEDVEAVNEIGGGI